MNGPRAQVHRREGKRRSPDPGDLRAIYGGHPDRVPVTAGPGGPVVRRDLAATPDRAARRRVTIISAPAGVPPGALGEFRAAGHLQPQLASSLARSGQVTGWLLATQARPRLTGEARAGLACWHQRALSGHSRSSARNPVAAKGWSRARRSPASGRDERARRKEWICRRELRAEPMDRRLSRGALGKPDRKSPGPGHSRSP
jgi:hypothetical protein